MAKRRRSPDEDEDADRDEEPILVARPRHRWRWLLLGLVLAVLALIWIAPSLIGYPRVRQNLLKSLIPDYPGSVEMESARLGWFHPVEIQKLSCRDAQNQPMLSVARVATDRSLWSLISASADLGTIRIEQPQLEVTLHERGSNLQDAIAAVLKQFPATSTASEPIAYRLEIHGGRLVVIEPQSQQRWVLDDLNLSAAIPASLTDPIAVQITATFPESTPPGTLKAQLNLRPTNQNGAAAEAAAGDSGALADQLAIECRGFPLELLQPFLRGYVADSALSGRLNADMQGSWQGQGAAMSADLTGTAQIQDFICVVPAIMKGDQLRLPLIQANTRALLSGTQLTLESLKVASELGEITARGLAVLPEAALDTANWSADTFSATRYDQVALSGQLDLAQLFAHLPHTLAVREGTRVSTGTLKWNLKQGEAGPEPRWHAELISSALTGTAGGRPLQWPKPMQIRCDTRRSDDGWSIDQLVCETDFLQATAKGNMQAGDLSARGDLGRMAEQLGGLFDLQGAQFGGQIQATGNWRQQADRQVQAQGQVSLRQVLVAIPQRSRLQEGSLELTTQLQGQWDDAGQLEVRQANCELASDADEAKIQLLKPAVWQDTASHWPLACELRGDLTRWLARLNLIQPLPGWQAAGSVQGKATLDVGHEATEIGPANFEFRQVDLSGPGFRVREPLIKVDTVARWDAKQRQLALDQTTFASSALAFRADKCVLPLSSDLSGATGTMGVRADIARLWQTLQSTTPGPLVAGSMLPHGELVGSCRIRQDQSQTILDTQAKVAKFGLAVYRLATTSVGPEAPAAGTWDPLWQDEVVTLAGKASYDNQSGRLDLSGFQVGTDGMRLTMDGTLQDLAQRVDTQLQGQLQYDWQQLTSRLRGTWAQQIRIVGKDERPFQLVGPLGLAGTSPDVNASAGMGWQQAQVFGFTLGNGELAAKYQAGKLVVQPIDCEVNEGRLKVAPELQWLPEPSVLRVPGGQIIQNVRISPEMCHVWMKYMAPMIADATRVDGRFSLALTGAQVPLGNPKMLTAGGVLQIHDAQIEPGPIAQQYLGLAQQITSLLGREQAANLLNPNEAWLKMKQQQIQFEVVDGRVHHRGLIMEIKDIPIQTTGWVAMDQTMEVVAEITVDQNLAQKRPVLANVVGQTLRIPVRGTLTRPQLDPLAVAQLSQQLLGGTARNLLEGELQKQLKNLFGPRK